MDGLLWSLFFCVYFFSAVVVKFTPVSDLDSNKRVSIGDPIVLYCEVSHPFGKVSWFKDGEELQVTDGLNIQSDGNMRRVVIQSADASHAGVYTCETSGEVIKFNVDVAGRRSLGQFSYSYTFECQLLTSIPPCSCLFRSTCGVQSSPRGGAPKEQHGAGPCGAAVPCLCRRC